MIENVYRAHMPKVWNPLVEAEVDNSKLPAHLREYEVWMNDIYTVFVRRGQKIDPYSEITMTWLSIKRNDKEPCRDWRHFQYIKNQLVGREHEGCELFPAESRLVDGSNQYHLWVFERPEIFFPFGFNEGRKISRTPLENGKQRPFEDNMLPEDIEECEKIVNEEIIKHLHKK